MATYGAANPKCTNGEFSQGLDHSVNNSRVSIIHEYSYVSALTGSVNQGTVIVLSTSLTLEFKFDVKYLVNLMKSLIKPGTFHLDCVT